MQADGTIKLMDFGLARMLTSDTLTAGNVLGTPHPGDDLVEIAEP